MREAEEDGVRLAGQAAALERLAVGAGQGERAAEADRSHHGSGGRNVRAGLTQQQESRADQGQSDQRPEQDPQPAQFCIPFMLSVPAAAPSTILTGTWRSPKRSKRRV